MTHEVKEYRIYVYYYFSNIIAEDYFSSLASPSRRLMQDIHEIQNGVLNGSETQDWDTLSEKAKEKLLDERLIDNLNGCSRPKPQKYHTLGHNSRRRSSRENAMQSSVPNGKTTIRLSTFGVEQVFPRLKIDTGQKEVTVEETSNGCHADDSTDNCVSCSAIPGRALGRTAGFPALENTNVFLSTPARFWPLLKALKYINVILSSL